MRHLAVSALSVAVVIASLIAVASAQVVTEREALRAAEVWVGVVSEQHGAWGGSESAMVARVRPFKRGERQLGYFCRVEPRGYVIIPLRREFGAIKAFSKTNDLDPESDAGPSALLKDCLERTLDAVQSRLGAVEAARTVDVVEMFESDHRREWEQLESGTPGRDYQGGDVLLTSHWHQREPYNDQCPAMGCTLSCASNVNALVGCVATAGAQILRYWNWPPYGENSIYSDSYDWSNMPDFFSGCTWTAAQRDAVAELCHEVGVAAGMNYGCRGSGTDTGNMMSVYESRLFCDTDCRIDRRPDWLPSTWFSMIQSDLNLNRPIQYRILGHSIVCDGWMITGSEPATVKWYHMNYGWPGSGDDIWYELDDLLQLDPDATTDEEYMVWKIFPETALGAELATGTYSPTGILPYYLDQDATGQSVTFDYYNWVQFRRGTVLTCTGPGWIRFRGYGPLSYESRIYSVGNMDPSDPHHNGIFIHDGDVVLKPGGSIVLH